MSMTYDLFTQTFLDKAKEYDFILLDRREEIVDGYMKRSCSQFNSVCKYDLTDRDDELREFNFDIEDKYIDEIVDIVTEGMLVQWMKPYVYRKDNLENVLNTTDYTKYSPAELLNRIASVYKDCKNDFKNMVKEYSYNHGDLTGLHL